MKEHTRNVRFVFVILVCGGSMAAAFLLEGQDHDETLSSAFLAIQQLNNKVNDLTAENQQLKARLQASETAQNSFHTDMTRLESRVSRDNVWYGDWILAFRATAGIGQPVYDAWTHVGRHDDDPMVRDTLPCGCSTVNGSLPCDRHYRSRLLDSWPSASIDQVLVVLYEKGLEKEHMTFSGMGSNYMSWFSQSRLVESSWTNLKTATGINFFGITGDTVYKRRFFVNLRYNSCAFDDGWLVVKDEDDVCEWGTAANLPVILYSPSNHDVNWSSHGFRYADVMAVFLKLRPTTELNNVCVN